MNKDLDIKILDTPNNKIDAIFEELTESFNSDKTLSLKFRKTQLNNLQKGIDKYQEEILEALRIDLGLNAISGFLGGIQALKTEIVHTIKHLDKWCAVENRKTPLLLSPAKSYVKPQARGVILVIASWNYPFATISPIINAIAAGNCVIMKPSEVSAASSTIFKKICEEFLDTRFYRCVEGSIATSDKLCSLPLNLICFTGSTYVGKIVAKLASANLTPCILELGGKCTTIVDETANLDLAAKRIVSNKFINCG